jgi:hypothetical protein
MKALTENTQSLLAYVAIYLFHTALAIYKSLTQTKSQIEENSVK